MDPAGNARLQRITLWALCLFLALTALALHGRYAMQMGRDDENSTDETEALGALRRYAKGETLYRDFRQPPHLFTPYGPLFYLVPGTAAKLLETDTAQFAVGRAYVYGCWLGIAGLIYALARQAGAERLGAGLGALLWLALDLMPGHAVSYRPDAPQVFFSLAGVWVGLRRDSWRHALGSAGLLAIACLHKQSAVVPVAALLLDWSRQGRWRHAAGLVGVWGLLVGGGLFLTQWLSGGAFMLNAFEALAIKATPAHVLLVLTLAIPRGLPVWFGAVVGATTDSSRPARFWRWYLNLAFLLALAGIWKFGSGPNYLLEPLAAGCVLCGLWWAPGRTDGRGLRLVWSGVTLAVAGSALMTYVSREIPRSRDWQSVLHCINAGERVLIEDQYLALKHSRTPAVLNPSLLTALARAGKFDDTPMLRAIEAKHFEQIVTVAPLDGTQRFRHFPPSWLAAIGEHYALTQTCSPVFVYIPRHEANR